MNHIINKASLKMGIISEILLKECKKKRFSRVLKQREGVQAIKVKIKKAKKEIEKKLSQTTNKSVRTYMVTQNLLSYFSEEISIRDEFIEYYDKVEALEEEYMPSYPPMSPITNAYFTYSCFCDLQFGREKETLGTIFYDLGEEMELSKEELLALKNMNESYMGIYQHLGFKDDLIKLKELSTGKEINCVCTANYKGKKNEIWYVRIVKNLEEASDYGITLTTPYVILNYGEKDWKQFMQRQGITGTVVEIEKKQYRFLKHNSDFKYWHNYIMDGYTNYTENSIYLTGMPDIKGSKPHELS